MRYALCVAVIFFLLTPLYVSAEPVFDANGFTFRDKVPTVSVGFVNTETNFKAIASNGQAGEVQADCVKLSVTWATKKDTALYSSFANCTPDFDSGYDSANQFDFGIYWGTGRFDTTVFADITYHDYTALGNSFIFNQPVYEDFSGIELNSGTLVDLYDGDRFKLSGGYELVLLSNFSGVGDVKRDRKFSFLLRATGLSDSGFSVVLQASGRAKNQLGLHVMKSF